MLGSMRWDALLLGSFVALLVGCGGEQAEECERYVACQEAYDEAFGIRPPTPTADYDEGGVCWRAPATAEACVRSCEITTRSLREAAVAAGQSLPACES